MDRDGASLGRHEWCARCVLAIIALSATALAATVTSTGCSSKTPTTPAQTSSTTSQSASDPNTPTPTPSPSPTPAPTPVGTGTTDQTGNVTVDVPGTGTVGVRVTDQSGVPISNATVIAVADGAAAFADGYIPAIVLNSSTATSLAHQLNGGSITPSLTIWSWNISLPKVIIAGLTCTGRHILALVGQAIDTLQTSAECLVQPTTGYGVFVDTFLTDASQLGNGALVQLASRIPAVACVTSVSATVVDVDRLYRNYVNTHYPDENVKYFNINVPGFGPLSFGTPCVAPSRMAVTGSYSGNTWSGALSWKVSSPTADIQRVRMWTGQGCNGSPVLDHNITGDLQYLLEAMFPVGGPPPAAVPHSLQIPIPGQPSISKGIYSWEVTSVVSSTYSLDSACQPLDLTGDASTSPPTATSGAASGVGTTTATLNGSANPNGLATSAYFQWGPTTSYGSATTSQSLGSGTNAVSVSANLTGLTPSTTYYIELVATNGAGTTNGGDVSFTTAPPGTPSPIPTPTPPTVTTSVASGISTTTATLNGSVNPNGLVTNASFQWGTTTSYGNTTTSQSAGSGASSVSINATLNGLSTSTTYHARLVATNSAGTTNGSDVAFTTQSLSPTPAAAPIINSISPPSVVGSTFELIINGTGFDATGAADQVYQPNGSFMGQGTIISRSSTQIAVTEAMAGAAPFAQPYTVKVKNPDGQLSNGIGLTLYDQVSVSPGSGNAGTVFSYTGQGFTGSFGVTSHLKRPDGTEFSTKQIATNASGKFSDIIDSTGFAAGTYDVWAIDNNTGVSSTHVTFSVSVLVCTPTLSSISPTSIIGSTFTLTANGSCFDSSGAVLQVYQPSGSFMGNGAVISRSTTQIVTTQSMAGAAPFAQPYTIKALNPNGQQSNGMGLTLYDQVSVSPSSGSGGTVFSYTGQGFTGSFGVTSHLKRPDGTEFSTLQIPTGSAGTFSTTINSTGFAVGTYEVWAIDNNTGVSSAHVTFGVH